MVVFPDERGRGIVATRSFEKGEFVVEYAGELLRDIRVAEAREVEYGRQDSNGSGYMFFFPFKNKTCW